MDYQKQAKDFLAACNATMQIKYLESTINPLWNELAKRDKYYVIITTPVGSMNIMFWDSIHNTHKNYLCQLEARPRCCKPTPYDVLACLQKYEVGDIDNFAEEFGYNMERKRSIKRIIAIYDMVVKEYNDLCRIFTPKQMEMLREIN